MNKFDFNKLDAKLNKQKWLQQKRKEEESKILKFHKDLPINPEVVKFVQIIHNKYQDHYNGNRYYSITQDRATVKQNSNLIKPIKLVQPVIEAMSYDRNDTKQKKVEIKVVSQVMKNKFERNRSLLINIQNENSQNSQVQMKKMNMLRLAYKFRNNIKIIIQRMKKMKITVQDIVQKRLFSKEPYLFGKQIFIAAKEGEQTQVFRLLIQNKFAVFSRDSTQKTPLMWTAIRNQHKVFELLFQVGSDHLARDFNGNSVWFYIIKYNALECAKILLLNMCSFNEKFDQSIMGDAMRKYISLYQKPSIIKMLKDLKPQKRDTYFIQQFKYYFHD